MILNPICGFFAVLYDDPKTLRCKLIGQYSSRKVAAFTADQYGGFVTLSEDFPRVMKKRQKALDKQLADMLGW